VEKITALCQTSQVPVNPSIFAKEPLYFSKINPRSKPLQKDLQNSHFLYVLAPVNLKPLQTSPYNLVLAITSLF